MQLLQETDEEGVIDFGLLVGDLVQVVVYVWEVNQCHARMVMSLRIWVERGL